MRMGSAILDGAPPSPTDKIYPSQSQPGDDTRSLLGGNGPNDIPDNDDSGDEMTPGKKVIAAVSMLMQANNILESVSPGFVPPPVQQWIAAAMEQGPLLAEQLARQGSPMALLSAVGATAAPQNGMGMGGGAPMGMQAMGIPPSQPAPGAGSPPSEPGGPALPGRPFPPRRPGSVPQ